MNANASDRLAELRERGFCVIENLVPAPKLARIAAAYDRSISHGAPPDLRTSSSGSDMRLADLVNRDAEFDEVYLLEPVLEVCASIIGESFRLSSLGARTVLPGARAQGLHVDVRHDQDAWPLVGFIVMVDEFRNGNGATRFVPGSHVATTTATTYATNARPEHRRAELACGQPGSVIVYNGSTWHGYSANDSGAPRRSIQGAYIPRRGMAAIDWAARMQPATAARISPLARHVLAVD